MEQSDVIFLRLALEEAGLAFSEGEVPVGAVLVRNGAVIARTHNTRERTGDPTAHAELIALRLGAQGGWRLSDATLYVTKEPCPMCAGAMVNARLGRLVYGCRDAKGGAVDSLYRLLSDGKLNHRVEVTYVTSGALEEECAGILKEFFKNKRGKS